MQLDMQTVSAVNVAVTAVLGGVLLLAWIREREGPLVGWWGLGLLLQALGVSIAAMASPSNAEDFVALGTAAIIFGDALKWKAAREFAYGEARLLWLLLGPVGFLVAIQMGFLETFDSRLNAAAPHSPSTTSPPPLNSRAPMMSNSYRAVPPSFCSSSWPSAIFPGYR